MDKIRYRGKTKLENIGRTMKISQDLKSALYRQRRPTYITSNEVLSREGTGDRNFTHKIAVSCPGRKVEPRYGLGVHRANGYWFIVGHSVGILESGGLCPFLASSWVDVLVTSKYGQSLGLHWLIAQALSLLLVNVVRVEENVAGERRNYGDIAENWRRNQGELAEKSTWTTQGNEARDSCRSLALHLVSFRNSLPPHKMLLHGR